MEYLSIKNYDKYQHYSDRRIVWIKLYVDLLDDVEFLMLPDATKAHLLMLWLLAAKQDNKIPNSTQFLTSRFMATEPIEKSINHLKEGGFLVPWVPKKKVKKTKASKPLAKSYQDASKKLSENKQPASELLEQKKNRIEENRKEESREDTAPLPLSTEDTDFDAGEDEAQSLTPLQQLQHDWNTFADKHDDIPAVHVLGHEQMNRCLALLGQDGFIQTFCKALEKLPSNDFYMGKVPPRPPHTQPYQITFSRFLNHYAEIAARKTNAKQPSKENFGGSDDELFG